MAEGFWQNFASGMPFISIPGYERQQATLLNSLSEQRRFKLQDRQLALEEEQMAAKKELLEQQQKAYEEGTSGLEKAFNMKVGDPMGGVQPPQPPQPVGAQMPMDAPVADAMPQFLQPPQQLQQAPAAGMDTQGMPSFLTPQGPQQVQAEPPASSMPPQTITEEMRRAALLKAGLLLARGGNEQLGNSIVSDLLAADGGMDPLKLSQIEKTQLETEQIRYKMLMDMQKNEMAKAELANNEQFFGSRNEFAEMFTARAQEAKDPEEKIRLKGFGVALRAAEDGKQMASILEQAMPGQFDGGKMTAFEGILRQSNGDAVKAFTMMEQIKANARTQYERAGGMLDEVATAYKGNRFYNLDPQSQQEVIAMAKQKEAEAAALAETEAKKREPLSGTSLDNVNKMDDMLDRLNTVTDYLKPEFVGRLTQYGLGYKDKAGVDPELSQFIGAWENFENYVLRPDSGAAIGINEEKAIRRQIGSLGHEYESLIPRLQSFKSYIESRRNRIIQSSMTPAGELQQKMDTEQERRSQERRERFNKPTQPAEPAKPEAAAPSQYKYAPAVKNEKRGEATIEKALPGLLGSGQQTGQPAAAGENIRTEFGFMRFK